MRYVPFGNNAVEVSEVILGTMRIGAPSREDAGHCRHNQTRARSRECRGVRLGDDARGVVRGVPLGGKPASLGSPIGHVEAHSLRWERMRFL